MIDPENFLSRWSRRKRDASHDLEAAVAPPAGAAATEHGDAASSEVSPLDAPAAEPDSDSPSLPAIADITADTDVSGFLRAGVPEELARAALRRAWSADPAIRDFVGLSENSWDFNAPDGMPGFGPIDPAEVERLISWGKPETATAEEPLEVPAQPIGATDESDRIANVQGKSRAPPDDRQAADLPVESAQSNTPDVAVQGAPRSDDRRVTLPPSAHGGALPE
jgi:Protein of unknown function (DUF3306)